MAMSVKRRIERNLPAVMGQRDPEAMIRVRSTDPIRASGLVPRQQAGHMTASDYTSQNAIKPLPAGGHPHMTGRSVSFRAGRPMAGVELAMTRRVRQPHR